MRSKRDPDDPADPEVRHVGPSFYERAIRTSIGRGLRRYYDLSEPIPDRMRELLEQMDEDEKVKPAAEHKPDTAKESETP